MRAPASTHKLAAAAAPLTYTCIVLLSCGRPKRCLAEDPALNAVLFFFSSLFLHTKKKVRSPVQTSQEVPGSGADPRDKTRPVGACL
jgi:hypothetical protein